MVPTGTPNKIPKNMRERIKRITDAVSTLWISAITLDFKTTCQFFSESVTGYHKFASDERIC